MPVNSALVFGGQAAGGTSGGDLSWWNLSNTAAPVAVTYTAEVQTVSLSGVPTGGTFGLTWRGYTASGIAYNVSAATLATALNTAFAPLLYGGTITVTGTGPWVVTFPVALGNVPAMTVPAGFMLLTGGTTPNVGVVETTPGAGANPATAVIPAGWKAGGWMDTSLTPKYADSSKDIAAFGAGAPVRTLLTTSKATFDVSFLESRPIAFEVFHRLAWGSVTVGADGLVSGVVDGPPLTVQYSTIFDIVDGDNRLRAYCPVVQNTSKTDMPIAYGDATKRSVTLTAYPDSSGNAIYWYPVMKGLIGMTGI
jgi:hypothetical protein